jgi:hypothetical protein
LAAVRDGLPVVPPNQPGDGLDGGVPPAWLTDDEDDGWDSVPRFCEDALPPMSSPRTGRPRFGVDLDLAAASLAAAQSMGVTANLLGVSPRTLRRRLDAGVRALQDRPGLPPADAGAFVVVDDSVCPVPPSADDLDPGGPPSLWAEDREGDDGDAGWPEGEGAT